MSPSKAIELWASGAITETECLNQIFRGLRPENIDEFLATCPSELLEEMKWELSEMPADDDEEGWQRMRSFSIVSYVPPKDAKARRKDERKRQIEEEKAKARHRQGVALMRSALNRNR